MKRIYLFLFAYIAFNAASYAQSIDLKTQMIKPTAGTTWDAGQYYPFEIVVTVVSGNITPSDTLWYGFTDGSSIYGRTNLTKGAGDTVRFANSIGYGTGAQPRTNYKWCSWAFLRKGTKYPDPTSSNDSGCTTINVTNTTGIGDDVTAHAFKGVNTLNIVPNPSSAVISFDFTTYSSSAIDARVIDITGREVIKEILNNKNVGQETYTLDISSLIPGIYFIQVSQEENKAVGKLLKQ